MALTATHRLLRRNGVARSSLGMLHACSTMLDRSKSTKSELVTLLERNAGVETDGVDVYDASAGNALAVLSCISWVQGKSWDGRWAVTVCSDVASVAHPSNSAGSYAILVGRGSLLRAGSLSLSQ